VRRDTAGGAGEAIALHRRLPLPADALALHAALTTRGRRSDTMLFERTAGPTLILDAAALRIVARGQRATAEALSANGENLLALLADRLAAHVTDSAPTAAQFDFPRPTGDDPAARLAAPSPFDVLRAALAPVSRSPEEPFTLALPGIVAFDHVDLFEDLPANAADPLAFPDFIFWVAESLVVIDPGAPPRLVCTAFGSDDEAASVRAFNDASQRLAALVARCTAAPSFAPAHVAALGDHRAEPDLDDAAYRAVVAAMRDHIAAGEVYQIVPSRSFRLPCSDPYAAYAALRTFDPSPYRYYVAAPDHTLFGASPETSVRVYRERGTAMVEVKPIAGTRPRGASPDEDDRQEADMRLDTKELAEHMMLVDLARNDVARVSASGTRRVARLMTTERYARVMHLVSSVTGQLREGHDGLHALVACLNVGTLSGAPKLRATQLLRGVEATKRGPYGGAIGWLNGDGDIDTGVVIRTAVVQDGIATVRAGAGVVHDSDPQAEADETRRKADAVISIIAGVEAVGGASDA
jgi:anthranilate synthase component 1